MLWVQLCNLLCCTSFRNILSGWISNFILPCLHLLYFLLDESSPTARMSELFFYLTCKVDVFCKYTVDYEALHMSSSSFLHRPRSILLSWLKLLTWKFKLLVVVSWLSRFWCRLVIEFSLSLSLAGAWNQGFWLPIQLHFQRIQLEK